MLLSLFVYTKGLLSPISLNEFLFSVAFLLFKYCNIVYPLLKLVISTYSWPNCQFGVQRSPNSLKSAKSIIWFARKQKMTENAVSYYSSCCMIMLTYFLGYLIVLWFKVFSNGVLPFSYTSPIMVKPEFLFSSLLTVRKWGVGTV